MRAAGVAFGPLWAAKRGDFSDSGGGGGLLARLRLERDRHVLQPRATSGVGAWWSHRALCTSLGRCPWRAARRRVGHLCISRARPQLDGAAPVAMDAHERAWRLATCDTSEDGVAKGEVATPERGLIASGARHRRLASWSSCPSKQLPVETAIVTRGGS